MKIDRLQMAEQDRADELAFARELFILPQGVVYLDGNSLGPLSKAAHSAVEDAVARQWGSGLIRAWNTEDWIHLPLKTGKKIARLIGAGDDEVIVADSTSVNLFKMLACALALRPQRNVVLTEARNFPSDLYVMDGLRRLLGDRFEIRAVPGDQVVDCIDDRVAVVCLTHVDYRSGAMHDLQAITTAAHRHGALVLWDLAHSAGAMPLRLSDCGVDLAVGCGYKFLNGGPGAPAFLYVARRWQDEARQPLTGWLGHADPFAFEPGYRPAPGISRHQCGTPPILSLVALDAALDLFGNVSLEAVRAKSVALGEAMIALFDQELSGHGFELASPRESSQRGSQVSFSHPDGHALVQALIARGIIGDYRDPGVLRFGLTPLYQRFTDIWDAVAATRDLVRSGQYREGRFEKRNYVT